MGPNQLIYKFKKKKKKKKKIHSETTDFRNNFEFRIHTGLGWLTMRDSETCQEQHEFDFDFDQDEKLVH